jgi:hypothetical protein
MVHPLSRRVSFLGSIDLDSVRTTWPDEDILLNFDGERCHFLPLAAVFGSWLTTSEFASRLATLGGARRGSMRVTSPG